MNPGPEVRRRLHLEVLVVLGISLDQSAVYALLSLISKLTQGVALNRQTTSINASRTPDRSWLDLAYQMANLVFPLIPVALVLYLLWVYQRPHGGSLRSMGFDLRRPDFGLGIGSAVFAGIGAGGLVLYYAFRELGYSTSVSPANLAAAWWTMPMLLLLAVKNTVPEEAVMAGYLFTRWRQFGGRILAVLAGSALIRGTYHLYQGFGGFVGNVVVGLLFGQLCLRTRRVMPLVVVHSLPDIFTFVDCALLKPHISWL